MSEQVVLLQYSKGYWTGTDGEWHLQIPDVLLKQEVREWLRENGYSTVITMKEGGARAEAYRVCRAPAYWRLVTDPRVRRTPAPEQPNKESEQD